jgi:hypothetical protein
LCSKAPEEDLKELLIFYFGFALNDKDIVAKCLSHFDTTQYGLSVASVKKLRKKWNLQSTRQQGHTIDSISAAVSEIRERFPSRGNENIRKTLLKEYDMRVPR